MTSKLLTLNITFTSNNIPANLKTHSNEVLASCSGGQLNFYGTTKNGQIAAETIAMYLADQIICLEKQITYLIVLIRGQSNYKAALLRKLRSFRLPIDHIIIQQYFTRSHNGCKLPKKRRK